ncbi:MAG: tRNA lysidine(34) synthetase TilS, partial [Planctomycetes bacterium]|nr:tRNA lysidine(34) synthetase TilS [Planctomycetota bacterium]
MTRKTLRPMRPKPLIEMRMPMGPVSKMFGDEGRRLEGGRLPRCLPTLSPGRATTRKSWLRPALPLRRQKIRGNRCARVAIRADSINAAPRPMAALPHPLPADWKERWPRLASAVGVEPSEPLVLGLSGGADSVLLLHWLCASEPRPPVLAVHVDHGLRGAESDADREFCAQLCRDNGVRFRARRIELAAGSNLEARAREARYAVLAEEAARNRVRVLLTGHHSDDGLETLLLRWIRGSMLAGLHGPAERSRLGNLLLVRPLIGMRRAEIRTLLREAGLRWRDDSSNGDLRHTRNRVREEFLPSLEQLGGAQALESLRKFAGAVEHLEQDLSRRTADLAWRPLSATRATRRAATSSLGGSLHRAPLARLPSA